MRSWPLLVLAAPAAAEVWSGWVGVAQKTGFGIVSPLPGIWPALHLDTAITLPVGVEAYAALALRAWLSGGNTISQRTRQFAKWSAISSLTLGIAGQVAYHLMDQAQMTRAPWAVTTLVSCLPVLVLAMGTALAHLLHSDASADDTCDGRSAGPASERHLGRSTEDQPRDSPDQDHRIRPTVRTCPRAKTGEPPRHGSTARLSSTRHLDLDLPHQPNELALCIARELAAVGKPVSRRALRSGGVKGSNESLNVLARLLNAEMANQQMTTP